MDLLKDTVMECWDGYWDAVSRPDKRVADWLLMGSYWPTWGLLATYLLIVYYGPKVMRDREAFEFRYTLFFYNMILVVMNFHIFYQITSSMWRLKYNLSCQPVDYSDNPDELRIAHAIWWYYFSKCVEFFDTLFFILRKKDNQITFLHVYHHATMFPIWYIGVKLVPGGQSAFGAMINSFVHVIMYAYYAISALGPSYQKYLWWKKYLTRLQLVQFVAAMVHAGQSLYFGCDFPKWMNWALILYGGSILLLFLNFYFQAYIRPHKKDTSSKANGHNNLSGGNAGISNGHVKQKDQ